MASKSEYYQLMVNAIAKKGTIEGDQHKAEACLVFVKELLNHLNTLESSLDTISSNIAGGGLVIDGGPGDKGRVKERADQVTVIINKCNNAISELVKEISRLESNINNQNQEIAKYRKLWQETDK